MSTKTINIGTIHHYDHQEMTVNVPQGTDVGALINTFFRQKEEPVKKDIQPEDVEPLDTSFFGLDRYTQEACEKQLREAITQASSKADACRRIMLADTCGFIHIRHLTDARKAELINPYALPLYTFTEEDFKKARNRPNKL